MEKHNLYDSENKLVPRISEHLNDNIGLMKEVFADCDDVVMKKFCINRGDTVNEIFVVYIDGLCDADGLAETVIKPLTYEWSVGAVGSGTVCAYGNSTESAEAKIYGSDVEVTGKRDFFNEILHTEAQTADIKAEPDMDKALLAVLKGDTAVFVDDNNQALVVSTKKLPLRSIGENDIEPGLRGPRDEFNEGFRQSTSLIRRRIRDPKLKLKQGNLGQRSRTDYGIFYLEGVADEQLVSEVEKSIECYDIDAIFDSGMAEQLMEGDWRSPFPKFQSTTRPDKVASGIVEGRVAVVFDNSPEVILAPVNFNALLQASDDYYNRWTVGSFSRVIRYIALLAAVGMPGLYIALTVHHSELLPTKLLFAIVNARYSVTFSVITEVLIMELFFELLREAGVRLPGPLGNTIGVVGGLIVGQAAVDAGIVSTIVVIVVALTAIASFAIPNEVFASVFRLLKFFIIFTSSLWGLYGFCLGLMVIVVHLSGLNSFGQLYLLSGTEQNISENDLDYVIKAPIERMINRPRWANPCNKVRLKSKHLRKKGR